MAIQFVQSKSVGSVGTPSSLAVAYDSANTAGNLLVCAQTTNQDPTAPTDTLLNSWQSALAGTLPSNFNWMEIFYVANCLAGSNTVTITLGIKGAMCIAEYSGIRTTSPLDQANSGGGFGTALSTGSINTTFSDELLVTGGEEEQNQSFSAGTNFNQREQAHNDSTNPNGCSLQDRIVTSTGSYSGAQTIASATNWNMHIASFMGPARTTLYIKNTYRPAPFRPGFAS